MIVCWQIYSKDYYKVDLQSPLGILCYRKPWSRVCFDPHPLSLFPMFFFSFPGCFSHGKTCSPYNTTAPFSPVIPVFLSSLYIHSNKPGRGSRSGLSSGCRAIWCLLTASGEGVTGALGHPWGGQLGPPIPSMPWDHGQTCSCTEGVWGQTLLILESTSKLLLTKMIPSLALCLHY